MPTPEHMQAAVRAYIAALNAGDIDAIVALYAEDATVEDPVGATPQRGLAEIRRFYSASLQMQLQVVLEGPVRAVANEAAFAFSVALVMDGQRLTIRPIDVMRFDDAGRITAMRAFFGPSNISHG
ncbi:steroid Delta-isomerase [Simplicispira psychrophila]|uniref:steroid Delta-isomerase n=1 Tax=Simplicispira psychrophila TaxID=80882 RepID=UPI00047F2B27|nr:steroid Delta-isomerase [Simplicispira psychrophila]